MTMNHSRELYVGDEVHGRCSAWIPRGCGFGFLHVDGVSKDVFVSAADLIALPDLRRGERVQFEVRMDDRGRLKAANVMLLDETL